MSPPRLHQRCTGSPCLQTGTLVSMMTPIFVNFVCPRAQHPGRQLGIPLYSRGRNSSSGMLRAGQTNLGSLGRRLLSLIYGRGHRENASDSHTLARHEHPQRRCRSQIWPVDTVFWPVALSKTLLVVRRFWMNSRFLWKLDKDNPTILGYGHQQNSFGMRSPFKPIKSLAASMQFFARPL